MNGSISLRERSLELSDLVLFKTVAEAGGVTRAAQRLHRVQSNVTARVKRLESHLGVPLFVRARRGMSLTPEGHRLLEYADRLLTLADEAQADLSARPPRGRLHIGAMESTAAVHLPGVLSRLHARYPALEVQLVTGTSGVLLEQVRAGELSAAFVAAHTLGPGLAGDRVFVEHLVLVTPASIRRRSGADALAGKTLVTFGPGCTYRSCIEKWLAGKGVRPPRVFEVASYHTMLACVAAGVGYAVVPRSVLVASRARRALRAHRLAERSWRITTWLVRREADRSRAVEALRQLVVRQG